MASSKTRGLSKWIISSLVALAFAVGVLVLLLWLAGRFTPKVPMTPATGMAHAPPPSEVAQARLVRVPLTETAVGTVRAVHETSIASKILARVIEVNLKAGQRVKTGDVLVRLNDADLQARLEQAKASLVAAQAVHAQAASDQQRLQQLLDARAASQQEYDRAVRALKTTAAEVERAQQAIKESQSILDLATVRATTDGMVVDKKIELGDTAMPGQVLVTIYDPDRMQLVASVRESLARRLEVGQSIEVQVDALEHTCSGNISEIVPQAQAASRTFEVKVTGPCPPGVYSGMFGRILIPLDVESVLMIPRRAVRSVGQLELVDVVAEGKVVRRAIRTGREMGQDIEVLSGLREGEEVSLSPTQDSHREANRG